MYEFLEHKFFNNCSEHIVKINDVEYCFCFKYDLEKTYSSCFNPGSYHGYYEKYSGMQPVDVMFDEVGILENSVYVKYENNLEDFDDIVSELEEYILENYDCN